MMEKFGVTPEPEEANEAATIKSLNSGDDLNSIEADLNSTKLDNLGAEMDAELQ